MTIPEVSHRGTCTQPLFYNLFPPAKSYGFPGPFEISIKNCLTLLIFYIIEIFPPFQRHKKCVSVIPPNFVQNKYLLKKEGDEEFWICCQQVNVILSKPLTHFYEEARVLFPNTFAPIVFFGLSPSRCPPPVCMNLPPLGLGDFSWPPFLMQNTKGGLALFWLFGPTWHL